MAYRLEKDELLADGVRRIASERLDRIERNLTSDEMDRDKAVHDSRKSFKRLRAAVRLVRDEVGPERYRQENVCFRDASRLLAGARDSAVMIETLDALVRSFPDRLSNEVVLPVRAKLVQRYEAVKQQMQEEGDAVAEVVATVGAARERLETLPIENDDFAAVAGGLQRVYRRGRNCFRNAYAGGNEAEKFHEWRKRVKYLWYQLEILQLIWPPLVTDLADQLHELSSYLGDDHDLAVLRHILVENPEIFAGEPVLPLLLELIEQRRLALQTAARPLGQRIYAEKPRSFVARMAAYWNAWHQEESHELQTLSDQRMEPASLQQRLLSTADAAALLGVSAWRVRRLIQTGALPALKLGNSWVIDREDLSGPAAS